MSNRKIGDYAVVGDTRTAALLDSGGSIDWLCAPRFDGEPVFARLVGGPEGGHFSVSPAEDCSLSSRRYLPGTAAVETVWESPTARLVATDAMLADVSGSLLPGLCLVRRVEAEGAPVRVVISFDPRFGEDRRSGRVRTTPHCVVTGPGGAAFALTVHPYVDIRPGQPVEVDVEPGRPLVLALSGAYREPLSIIDPDRAWDAAGRDMERWREWSSAIQYDGPWPEMVERSLITLRLLTYSPSGAPVAAPTTSLPEWPGGSRNWDYRFAWPRDASIGVAAFLAVGQDEQARAFLYWLLHASRLDRPRLAPVLTIHGKRVPGERHRDGWPGFAGSRPVRFGNGARDQHQLDTYGWVLDAMWLVVKGGQPLYGETWRAGQALADHVARQWRQPDAGIWEVRDAPAHYVHSKLMAWLALDRALRIADVHAVPARRRQRWQAERDALAAEIVARGFDTERNTFVRAYGQRDLDAAVLVLPLLGIEASGSPRVRGTIEAVRRELSAGGPLLYRYPPGSDGVPGSEGAFLPCSFWLVQALAASGAVDEANALFSELVSYGGPLALFAEEADPATGRALGNYPQALTHAAVVQAALAIRDAS